MSDRMRAAVVPEPGANFQMRERALPEPGREEVRVAVEACGVCRGDVHAREDETPGAPFPRVPGHEFVGHVDAVGERVETWAPGDRVGVGWHGGHCLTCDPCRHGAFLHCEEKPVTGAHRDGGYAEYALARREALAAVPEGPDAAPLAPLLCAGLTTYNALRHADAMAGDLVAVVGVGGLGHVGLGYAAAMGFETVAVSRGPDKREAALDAGADHFVDSEARDPGEALSDLGGASVVLSTAPASEAVEPVVSGLARDGEVVAAGIPDDPVSVHLGVLADRNAGVSGWASGTPIEAEETLAFSVREDVSPEVERYGLDDVETAYGRMVDGDVRFRAVIEP